MNVCTNVHKHDIMKTTRLLCIIYFVFIKETPK